MNKKLCTPKGLCHRSLCMTVNNEADQYTMFPYQYTVLWEQYTVQHSILIHGAVYCSRTRLYCTPYSIIIHGMLLTDFFLAGWYWILLLGQCLQVEH